MLPFTTTRQRNTTTTRKRKICKTCHTYVSFLGICHLVGIQRKHVLILVTFVWPRVIWAGVVWLYWSVQRCTPMFSAGRRVPARRCRRRCAAVSIGRGGNTRAAWLPVRPALLAARYHRRASAVPVRHELTFPAYPLYTTKFYYVSPRLHFYTIFYLFALATQTYN